jgi:hypothetical protein
MAYADFLVNTGKSIETAKELYFRVKLFLKTTEKNDVFKEIENLVSFLEVKNFCIFCKEIEKFVCSIIIEHFCDHF